MVANLFFRIVIFTMIAKIPNISIVSFIGVYGPIKVHKIFHTCKTHQGLFIFKVWQRLQQKIMRESQNPDIFTLVHVKELTVFTFRSQRSTVPKPFCGRLDLCIPHHCHGGFATDVRGIHRFVCRRAPGRSARHHALNDLVARRFALAGVPVPKEPMGLPDWREKTRRRHKACPYGRAASRCARTSVNLTVDSIWTSFKSIIYDAFDEFVPIRRPINWINRRRETIHVRFRGPSAAKQVFGACVNHNHRTMNWKVDTADDCWESTSFSRRRKFWNLETPAHFINMWTRSCRVAVASRRISDRQQWRHSDQQRIESESA